MSIFKQTIQSMRMHLSAKQKKEMVWLAVLIFIQGVLDVFGLGLIIPVINIASSPEVITQNKFHLGDIYQFFHFTSTNNFILFILFAVLGFYIAKTAFGLFVYWVSAKFATEVAVHITQHQYDKYYAVSYLDFTNIKSSVITNHVFNNPASYLAWVVNPAIIIFSEIVIVTLIVVAIVWVDITLFACIVAVIGPATFMIYYALKNKSALYGVELDKVIPKVYASLNASVNGYIDVKLAGKETDFRSQYMHHIRKYHDIGQKANFIGLVPLRAYEIVALLSIVVIFVYVLFITAKDASTAVVLVGAFAAAAYRLMPSMNRIVGNLMYIRRSQSTINNLNYYANHIPGNASKPVDGLIAFDKTIVFDKICYRFPDSDKYVLHNITFEVNKGEKIGFVGASGSGKTTLMNILLRFITEGSGQILIDNTPLTEAHLLNWRKLIGYVKQDIFIMDGTIKENIAFGETEVDDRRLMRAISQASLSDLVRSLPDGVNSVVGEKGSRLSGGQRQRI
ncbi:MAG TPA: ABC transporter ATP-binding protein, partial [Bacteroidia bacterium]|nr:ABC transporter ATP-binding protein [Bacteroidia bacterium]